MEKPIYSKVQTIDKFHFFHMMGFYKSKPLGLVGVKYFMRIFTTEYKYHPDEVKNVL